MDVVILQSAYKHGISEKSIRWCLSHCENSAMLDAPAPKYIFAGFDHKGNPLEIIAIENTEENQMVIIHAMKLRKQHYSLLEGNEHELQ